MTVQDFNWDEGAVLNLLYLYWDVNSNPDLFSKWNTWTDKHTFKQTMTLIESVPERTKKFAILFSLHERRLKREGKMWNENGLVDYESAIAALLEIMNCTTEFGAPYHTVNDVCFCDVCGMPMCEGYMLDPYETCGGHYCSTHCYKSDITEEELDDLLDSGILIYTDWEGSGDSDEVELIY